MIEYRPQFAPNAYFLRLLDLPWEARAIRLYGRLVMQPRLITWAGPVPYTYSGQTLPPRRPSEALQELFELVRTVTGESFNHVLCNRYRDGNDSIGWHSDDEPELGTDPLIVSLSFGEPRRFLLRPKASGLEAQEYTLGRGDLLIMGRGTQARYEHSVPKTKQARGERVNLTFRQIR